MRDKQECGCVHDGHAWLGMCGAHRAEHDELHARAARDRMARAESDFTPTPEYAALAGVRREWLEG